MYFVICEVSRVELSERKLKILQLVVDQYIETSEPVGSKVIAAAFGNALSSATIRNEMAALEKMGILAQPHTSAGRVPTPLGFRIYIDHLNHIPELDPDSKENIDSLFAGQDPDPERIVELAAEMLAGLTNYAAITTTPSMVGATIKQVTIVPVNNRVVIIALETVEGVVKTSMCKASLEGNALAFCNTYLGECLQGVDVNDITPPLIQTLASNAGEFSLLITPILYTLYQLTRELVGSKVHLEGQANLLSYEDISSSVIDLVNFLSHTKDLSELMGLGPGKITVVIGDETNRKEMRSSSVVSAKYQFGDRSFGAVGIVGPTRMDYPNVMAHLAYFSEVLGKLLSQTFFE